MQPRELVGRLNAIAPPDYGMGQEHPPIDDLVEALIQAFRSASTDQRKVVRDELNTAARNLLLNYAWERAVEAVRQESPKAVADGLIALCIDDGGFDLRDSIVRMAVLFRSAEKLGLDAVSLFHEAADVAVNPAFKDAIRAFPSRPPEQRDLGKAFFIVERFAEDGFTYEEQPWPVPWRLRPMIWKARLRRLLKSS